MASDIVSITSHYVTVGADLLNNEWRAGDSVYLRIADMKVLNKNTGCFVNVDFGTNGIISQVQEPADITVPGDRLVIRLTASATQNARLKTLLQATEL